MKKMSKYLKQYDLQIVDIILVALIFISAITVIQLPLIYNYYIQFVIAVIIISFYIYEKRKLLKEIIMTERFKILSFILLSLIIILLYSIIVIFVNNYNLPGSFSRSFSVFIFSVIIITEAYCIVDYYSLDKAIKLITIALLSNYFLSLLISICKVRFDLTLFIDYFITGSSQESRVILESHELAPCFAIILIYFFLNKKMTKEKKRRYMVPLVIAVIMCNKRIITFALLLILASIYIFEKIKWKHKEKAIYALPFVEIISSYIYVYLLKSGSFYEIMGNASVNLMQRDKLYIGISKIYEFSPLYIGNGLGFASKWLDYNWMSLGIYGATTSLGLHNDILRFFIELGFIGALMAALFFLVFIPLKIARSFGKASCAKYCVLFAFLLVCSTVDQLSSYYIFLTVFFILVFAFMKEGEVNE